MPISLLANDKQPPYVHWKLLGYQDIKTNEVIKIEEFESRVKAKKFLISKNRQPRQTEAFVTPANAGVQPGLLGTHWIPAYAGMTKLTFIANQEKINRQIAGATPLPGNPLNLSGFFTLTMHLTHPFI